MKPTGRNRLLSVATAAVLAMSLADLARSQIEDFLVFDCASFGGNCTREIADYDPKSFNQPLTISLDIPEKACDIAAAVGVRLEIEHTWVGDLEISLTQESSNRTVVLMDRPGVDGLGPYGCPGHDVDVRIHDDKTVPGVSDYTCEVTVPAITGDAEHSGLSAFANLPCAGTWTLEVADRASPNFGRVLDWSLLLLPAATATPTASNTPTFTATATATSTELFTSTPDAPTATPTGAEATATPTDGEATATPTDGEATATPTDGEATATPTDGEATATPTNGDPPPTQTPPTPGACVGDCDGNGVVSINELVRGVLIALEQARLDTCPSFDRDNDGAVEISELIAAVNNALNGCP